MSGTWGCWSENPIKLLVIELNSPSRRKARWDPEKYGTRIRSWVHVRAVARRWNPGSCAFLRFPFFGGAAVAILRCHRFAADWRRSRHWAARIVAGRREATAPALLDDRYRSTFSARRSARSSGETVGALEAVAASEDGALAPASVRKAAIASRSWRRWPTTETPRSFRSSAVRL